MDKEKYVTFVEVKGKGHEMITGINRKKLETYTPPISKVKAAPKKEEVEEKMFSDDQLNEIQSQYPKVEIVEIFKPKKQLVNILKVVFEKAKE
jgi:hypothetical protein